MLIPVLLRLPAGSAHASHLHSAALQGVSTALAAVVVHTAAMLASAGLVALIVYEWVGLAFLRRGWMVKCDAAAAGGLTLDAEFFLPFEAGYRPHQVRLQGGDSSSDTYCYP
ncbi:MAG: hypothetical protein E6K52_12695 [Gammaproteobacteria bacterium]|nr:MAG: hypothetical protein E6K52_12695 [Gammaproteobacteria bacterium]